jgi:hypothetical protein
VDVFEKMSVANRLAWYSETMSCAATPDMVDLARGYDSRDLIGSHVMYPMPMFPVYGYDTHIEGVKTKSDVAANCYPLVVPWVGVLGEVDTDDVSISSCDGLSVPLTAPRPPQVGLFPHDFPTGFYDEYGIRIPVWDARLITPRQYRDWERVWRHEIFASKAFYLISVLQSFLETGELDYLFTEDDCTEMAAAYEQLPADEQERLGGLDQYCMNQAANIETALLNEEGTIWVDPLGHVDPASCPAFTQAYSQLKLNATEMWSALNRLYPLNTTAERYPWA